MLKKISCEPGVIAEKEPQTRGQRPGVDHGRPQKGNQSRAPGTKIKMEQGQSSEEAVQAERSGVGKDNRSTM